MVPFPLDEAQRLVAAPGLREFPFSSDAIHRIASTMFAVPTVFISFIGNHGDRFPSLGLLEAETTAADAAFAAAAILSPEACVVPLAGAAGRFFAGAPLVLQASDRIGTLCIADDAPRVFGAAHLRQLQDLADLIGAQLRLVEVAAHQAAEIADRRAYEHLIQARARDVRASMGEGLVVLDRSLRVLEINAEALRLEGRSMDAIVGKAHWQVWAGDDKSAFRQALELAMDEGVFVTTEHQGASADGARVWFELRVYASANGLTLFYRDVSDRKQAEAELREAHYRAEASAKTNEAILGQLAEGVIVTDAAGRISFVNEASATIHGVARLDVEPDAYAETYHLYTEDGQPHIPFDLPLARAVRGETVRDARWRIRRPDGTEVLAIGSAQPLRGSDGRQIGAVLTLRDDTARDAAERSLRDSEAQLRTLNATLSLRVIERTRDAEASRAQAEAASRAKSEFLAAMSHEIRTPLSGILGYTDLLLEEPSIADGVRQHGERIRSAGSALLTIVNDVLDFSKIEAGHIELVPEPFSPSHLLDEAVSIVRASAERKGLVLRIEATGAVPARVVGDRDRLRQVLLNLLNNAIKFTRVGTVTLVVEVLRGAPGIARLRFAVRDTGIGIPAAKRHLLFERFSQIDGTIQREFGGTGLGLAISKRLIELMGGSIGVDSEIDRGSTFWVELDLILAAGSPVPVAASPIGPKAGSPRRLLLVEDVVLNQELACAVLKKGGHVVDVVSGGLEAIEAVQVRDYDLVLMDVQMPGMDGITATQRIRALEHPAAAVPIVAMTANVLPHQVLAFKAAGMQDHVGKPFKRDVLFAVIERWAHGAPAATPDEAARHDTNAFETLVDMIGRATVDRLLVSLAKELRQRLGADGAPPERNRLAADAHAMVSAAAMLGFVALADLCREVEAVCRSGQDYAPLVTRLDVSRRATLRAIDALKAA